MTNDTIRVLFEKIRNLFLTSSETQRETPVYKEEYANVVYNKKEGNKEKVS